MRVRTQDGRVEGLRVNEDAFTIQVRDVSGKVHSFRKDKLLEFEQAVQPQPDAGIRGRTLRPDLDDVVSYLMSLRSPE